ncbi:MAG: Maf family protein [bacterium]|nr:Maf family protein [bacterium]
MKSTADLELILASSAPWRSQALTKLGVHHQATAPEYVEPSFEGGPLEAHVMRLAHGKAQSLRARFPGKWILAFDQLAEVDGQVLGKPGDFATAFEQLSQLQGKAHRLVNGMALLAGDEELLRWDQAWLTIRELEPKEIETYLKAETPYQCAGSYKIEGLGASLFERIEVTDLGSILGLPANLVLNALRELDYSNLLPPEA